MSCDEGSLFLSLVWCSPSSSSGSCSQMVNAHLAFLSLVDSVASLL